MHVYSDATLSEGNASAPLAANVAATITAMPVRSDNNLNLLRLLAATLVVLGHFALLAGYEPLGIHAFAHFAVDAFFVISGYLIYASFDRAPYARSFYIRRFFRIYPLYCLMILVQAAAMLWLWGGVTPHLHGLLRYLFANLTFANFLAYDIDGLLAGLDNRGINPSLWTLKIEVAFYLLLPFLWGMTRRFGTAFLVASYVLSCLFVTLTIQHHPELAKQFPGQLRFFVVGMALYRARTLLEMHRWMALALGLGLAVISWRWYYACYSSVYPLTLGLAVILLGTKIAALPMRFDISYGVYLVHGPLIQISLLTGFYQHSTAFLAMLLGGVFLLAFACEEMLEKPFIRLGRRLSADPRLTTGAGGVS